MRLRSRGHSDMTMWPARGTSSRYALGMVRSISHISTRETSGSLRPYTSRTGIVIRRWKVASPAEKVTVYRL